jgi:hypothetical protein
MPATGAGANAVLEPTGRNPSGFDSATASIIILEIAISSLILILLSPSGLRIVIRLRRGCGRVIGYS